MTASRTRTRRATTVAALASGLTLLAAGTAAAEPTPPDHAVIVCQSASFYHHYDSAGGPVELLHTLPAGNKVGHTRGAHEVRNGWAATFDFGTSSEFKWGWVRYECLGGWGSW
jgi:hypothetical protein